MPARPKEVMIGYAFGSVEGIASFGCSPADVRKQQKFARTVVMHFSDDTHSVAGLAFHGAMEVDPEQNCRKEVIEALVHWRHRPNYQLSGTDLLRIENCALFSITYEGKAGEYWPAKSENDISETLVREFLYPDGICTISDERVRLYRMSYNLIALDGDEYVLVCPYLTGAGNISGIVVVCVTKMILGRP